MVPGGQGIATKESDMYQQKLVWSEGPLSVYEWSKLDLGAMLHRRPTVEEKTSGNDEELAKLRQLKNVLKSLS